MGGDVNIPGPVPINAQGSITLNRGSSSITSSATQLKLDICLITKLEVGSVSGELVECSLSPGTISKRTQEEPLASCPRSIMKQRWR